MEPYTYSDQYFKDFKTKQPMMRMLGEGANKLAQRVNPAVGAATAYQVANLATDLATGYNIDERLTDVASRGMGQQEQYASMSAPLTSFDFLGTNVNTANMPMTKTGTTAVGQAQNITAAPVDQYGSTMSALGEQGMQQARQNEIMNQEINEPVSSLASDTAYGVTPSYGTLDKVKAPSTIPDYTGYSRFGDMSSLKSAPESLPGFTLGKEPPQQTRIGEFAEKAGDVTESIVRFPGEFFIEGANYLFNPDRPGFNPLKSTLEKSFASQNAVTQDAVQKDAETATAITEEAQKPQTLMPEGFDETGTKIDPQTGKPLEVAMNDAEKLQLARDFGLREDLGFRYDPSTGAITKEQAQGQLAPGVVRAIEYGGADVFKRYDPAEQRFVFTDASGNLVGEDASYAKESFKIMEGAYDSMTPGNPNFGKSAADLGYVAPKYSPVNLQGAQQAETPMVLADTLDAPGQRKVGGPETTIRRDFTGGLSKNDFRRIAKAKNPNASRNQISAMAEQMMLEQQQKAAATDLAAQKAQADIAKTQQMTDYYEAATGAKLRPDTDTRAMTSVEQEQAIFQDLQPIFSKVRNGQELTDAEKNKLAVANLMFPQKGGMIDETPIERLLGGADIFASLTQGTSAPPPPSNVDITSVIKKAVPLNSKEGKQIIKTLEKTNKGLSREDIIEASIEAGYLLPEE